jgi:hypothetical protein
MLTSAALQIGSHGDKEEILSRWRRQVGVARGLSGLAKDPLTNTSIADRIYNDFAHESQRSRYKTVSSLSRGLEGIVGTTAISFAVVDTRRTRFRDSEANALDDEQVTRIVDQRLAQIDRDRAHGGDAEANAAQGGGGRPPPLSDDEIQKRPVGEPPVNWSYLVEIYHKLAAGDPSRWAHTNISEIALWNSANPDGVYGAKDIGECPWCMSLKFNANKTCSVSMEAFKAEHNGKGPTSKTRKAKLLADGKQSEIVTIPDDTLIRHTLPTCRTIYEGLRYAARHHFITVEEFKRVTTCSNAEMLAQLQASKRRQQS